MWRLSERAIAYLAFFGFCALSAVRDVLSELIFKDPTYDANPVFVLFVYGAVTQVVAALIIIAPASLPVRQQAHVRLVKKELILINVFTLAAFLFYFLAISSPLGSALNASVDYGSSPVFTAAMGAILAKEAPNRRFYLLATASLVGVIVLAAPRLQADHVSVLWVLGLLASLLSSASSACYRVYFRLLLQRGMGKAVIVFVRLIGLTTFLGLYLVLMPDLFHAELLIKTALLGLVGFTAPLFLVLTVIQRVEIPRFAMLLFLFPALTYLLSSIMGYGDFYVSDLFAAGVLTGIVIFHETKARPRVLLAMRNRG